MSSDINVQTFSGKVNITSNLLVGSTHLFVDTINNRVGLVTKTPSAGLHVNSNAYVHTDFRVGSGIVMNDTTGRITAGAFHGDGTNITGINSDSGSWVNGTDVVYLSTIGDKVGIGTNAPDSRLHIEEPTSIGATTTLFHTETGFTGGSRGHFEIKEEKHGAGTGWSDFNLRLQRRVDSIVQGYMDFNPSGTDGDYGIAFGTGSTELMRIKSDGNVGIGTTSPGAKLDVNGAVILTGGGHGTRPANDGGVLANAEIRGGPGTGSAGFLRLSGGGYNNGSAADATSKTYIDLCGYSGNSDFDRNMTFNTLNQERMRINLGGNVGIGSTAPTQVLDVAGHIGCTGLVTGGVLIRSAANLNISAGTFIKVADYSSLVVGGNNYLVTVAWNSYVAGGSQRLWIGAASWYSSTQGGAQRIYAPWNSNQVVAATQVYHFRTISAFSFVESAVTPTGGNYQAHGIQMTNTQSTGTANAVSAKVRLIGSWT